MPENAQSLTFHPLTPDRWPDCERLFSANRAVEGCWCMWWRLRRSEFSRNGIEGNKRAFQDIVAADRIPGILAYSGEEPVGWCSVAPRDEFPALDRSPTRKRIDDQPVWSIVCFFVAKSYRRRGVSQALIQAALDYVAEKGGRIVEAYPPADDMPSSPSASFMGFVSTFAAAGFVVVSPPGERPATGAVTMRYYIRVPVQAVENE